MPIDIFNMALRLRFREEELDGPSSRLNLIYHLFQLELLPTHQGVGQNLPIGVFQDAPGGDAAG